MAPVEIVAFLFATATYNTGTVLFSASMPGIQLNLNENPSVTVSYDANDWEDNTESWATQIAANATLKQYLIISSNS